MLRGVLVGESGKQPRNCDRSGLAVDLSVVERPSADRPCIDQRNSPRRHCVPLQGTVSSRGERCPDELGKLAASRWIPNQTRQRSRRRLACTRGADHHRVGDPQGPASGDCAARLSWPARPVWQAAAEVLVCHRSIDCAGALSEIDVEVPKSATVEVASTGDGSMGGATDVATTGTARVEQRALRAFLVGTQTEAQCGLCGRTLPTELLVAGHIKPRSQCSEVERWDFAAVAMLNCALGCDALFERGYITVDGDGQVQSGRAAWSDAVGDTVASLPGKKAFAHNADRAAAFHWHPMRSLAL